MGDSSPTRRAPGCRSVRDFFTRDINGYRAIVTASAWSFASSLIRFVGICLLPAPKGPGTDESVS